MLALIEDRLSASGTDFVKITGDVRDPWWNPAVEAQAIDRSHRIGQDKPVFVHRLVTPRTIEQKMLELQRRKDAEIGNHPAGAADI